jgi:hypothetical protein
MWVMRCDEAVWRGVELGTLTGDGDAWLVKDKEVEVTWVDLVEGEDEGGFGTEGGDIISGTEVGDSAAGRLFEESGTGTDDGDNAVGTVLEDVGSRRDDVNGGSGTAGSEMGSEEVGIGGIIVGTGDEDSVSETGVADGGLGRA